MDFNGCRVCYFAAALHQPWNEDFGFDLQEFLADIRSPMSARERAGTAVASGVSTVEGQVFGVSRVSISHCSINDLAAVLEALS
jgi:hypothetical protein